ncbi:MAG: divergent PAP2 family protein [Candidatus Moraniibacteriota bacterium]|nr:MAG: divergent PAP2 family protein [Candidatus Moranbacteria bacterium]
MDFFSLLDSWAVFLIPIAVGTITQAIKFIVYSLKHGWNPQYAFTHGHMPSAHTAFVTSLVTSVGWYAGMDSGAFAISIILAVIVIDDAVRLRMYMGDQGRYLNMLIRQLDIDEEHFPRLKERIGHRISEVIIGGIFGSLLAFFFIFLLA